MEKCPGQDTRYWTPEDIYEAACPNCGASLEFFKDDPFLFCPGCAAKVENPKLSKDCAAWCAKAGQCLGSKEDK